MRLAVITPDECGTRRPTSVMDWETGDVIEGPFEFRTNGRYERVAIGDGRFAHIRDGELVGGTRRKP